LRGRLGLRIGVEKKLKRNRKKKMGKEEREEQERAVRTRERKASEK
jgi:hypothetical protein